MKFVKEKEKMWEYAICYWKYIFSFCLLQFLDMFLSKEGFHWTPFLSLELLVFGIIGLVLFGIHAYYYFHCKFRNREVHYDKILKEYYVDNSIREYSNFGICWKHVMTLMAHPEMHPRGKADRVFWGWADDGIIGIAKGQNPSERYENGFSLKKRPWTCTEQKNINLEVVQPLSDEQLSEEKFRESFEQCMKKDIISYSNQLFFYPLFLDEEGRVVKINFSEEQDGVGFLRPMLVTEDLLDMESEKIHDNYGYLKETIFQKSVEQLQILAGLSGEEKWKTTRFGIASVFQQTIHQDNELPKIGLLSFIQLESSVIEQLMQVNAKLTYLSTDNEIIEFLFDETNSEIDQYALLMYVYTKKKRYEFVESFIGAFRKIEKTIRRKKLPMEHQKQNKIYLGTAEESISSKIKLWIRRQIYNLSKFIVESPWNKILFLVVFALENVIEPFTAGSAKVEITVESIWEALVIDNIGTIILLMTMGVCWIILLFVFSLDSVKKKLNPGLDMVDSLTTTDKKEKYVQIGKNTNLFWADDLVEGWDGDKVEISVVREDYRLTEELRQYENEKIRDEKNDGTKFRMISVSEDEERDKLQILVDRCKYTDTMRVQEMLRQHRASVTGEACYSIYRNELINLKERSAAIRLENIPPNSMCMHAVIITKDDYVLLTTRGENLSYYPGAYDCSAEEQLHMDDFEQDGVRIKNWVTRFLEEEIGLTADNCGSSTVGKISLLSVFIEEDALNIALAVKIRLNTTKKQLEAILDNWPRKDYEFKYQLVNWEALVEQFELVQRETGKKDFHPTCVNRIYLVACSEMRFDMANRIYQAYINKN